MNSYKVLKFDDHFVYLTQDGKIKKLARDLFDFDIALGDRVDYIQDGDIVLVIPSQGEMDTSSGNLKKIFSQLLVTLFMAWSLLGVVVIELLLLLESLISVIWRLLVKGIKNLHIVDNSRKYMAYRKRQEAIRNQENHEEEERLLRLDLEQEKLDKKDQVSEKTSETFTIDSEKSQEGSVKETKEID